MPDRPRPTDERGSVLMLMPVGVMIVLFLGAIAVDLSLVQAHQRSMIMVAEAAANDAVTAGLDPAALRSTGALRLDPDRVDAALVASLEANGFDARDLSWDAVDATSIRVELHDHIEPVFGRALPGHRTIAIVGSATATAVVTSNP